MDIFKSKGFTAAFIVLAVLIVLFSGILIYIVVGNARGSLNGLKQEAVSSQEQPQTEAAPETESDTTTESTSESVSETATSSETEELSDDSLSALQAGDERIYPVVNELVPIRGVVSIVKPGDNGEGVVFHKNPAFDDANSPGNLSNLSGAFDVDAKIYILDNGKPYKMYKTSDDYYVTSNKTYISYEPQTAPVVEIRADHPGTYSGSENSALSLQVYGDDGNHVVFTFYEEVNGVQVPVLENIVAAYESDAMAHFEYRMNDKVYGGTLSFSAEENGPVTMNLGAEAVILSERVKSIEFKK